MFYLGLAICFLITGLSLIVGDGTLLRVPYNFGEHKSVVGVLCVGCSMFLFWAAKKALRTND